MGGNNEKYLLVLSAAKRVNWKPLDKVYGKLGPLAADKAMEVSGCLIGAIPPFGSCLKTKGIKTIVDPSVQEQGRFIWLNAGFSGACSGGFPSLAVHDLRIKAQRNAGTVRRTGSTPCFPDTVSMHRPGR